MELHVKSADLPASCLSCGTEYWSLLTYAAVIQASDATLHMEVANVASLPT